jgi:4-amino-4-deoxy-L-arabinose transferase-like glycosyltransferase
MSIPTETAQPDKTTDSRHTVLVFMYLLVLSFIIRFPFFFPIVINNDESTYILWGQSVLDGYLPYTGEVWGFKPPLAFLFYAGAIALFGKSIVSVRIAGALCVAFTAFFTYLTGKALWNHRAGIVGATLFTMMVSFIKSGQAVMTEHVAIVPMVGALSLLVIQRHTPSMLFFAGILMGIATCVRTNLAYVSVLVGFFLVISAFAEPPRSIVRSLKGGLAYAAGGLLILLLVFLPYVATGNQKLWWTSVVLAPLSYVESKHFSLFQAFSKQLQFIREPLSNIEEPLFGISALVWLAGLAGLVTIFVRWRNTSREKRLGSIALVVFLLGTELSILKGGWAYTNYLIQIVPFMALAAAGFLNGCYSGYARWLITGIVLLALTTSMVSVIPEYKNVVSRILSGQSLTYGAPYEIAEYLRQENASREPIYMMTEHIVYWLIDAKPLSKSTTHPANIRNERLLEVLVGPGTTTEMELANVLAKKPRFIVTGYNTFLYLHTKPAALTLLRDTLHKHYELVREIEGRHIYRRR